jgi:GTP-binding protein
MPVDESDTAENIRTITNELGKYSQDLLNKECWLVINKIDLLPPDEVDQYCKELVKRLQWNGRVFPISGIAKLGIVELAQEAMRYLEEQAKDQE